MRISLLLMVVLGGCVADAEEPHPIEREPVIEIETVRTANEAEMDVCALASRLETEDICSLICDPTGMAARLVDEGSDRGICYQFYCALPDDEHVLVGLCLPP